MPPPTSIPRLLECSDDDIVAILVPEYRAEFQRHVQEVKDITVPKLPTSLTPADLSPIYNSQAYISAHMSRLSVIVAEWHRHFVEAAALKELRETDNKEKTFRFIIHPDNQDAIHHYKSEAQKLTHAADALNLQSTKGVTYLTELLKGWYAHFNGLYQRLEKQQDAVLTHTGILRSELNLTPK